MVIMGLSSLKLYTQGGEGARDVSLNTIVYVVVMVDKVMVDKGRECEKRGIKAACFQ